jgi:hypothetical protein
MDPTVVYVGSLSAVGIVEDCGSGSQGGGEMELPAMANEVIDSRLTLLGREEGLRDVERRSIQWLRISFEVVSDDGARDR